MSRFGKRALAALLVSLVLLLDAMAAVPALHELVHKDAESAGHSCVVTLFAHGHVESAVGHLPVTPPATLVATRPPLAPSLFSTTIEDLPPGRAPPQVASPQT